MKSSTDILGNARGKATSTHASWCYF